MRCTTVLQQLPCPLQLKLRGSHLSFTEIQGYGDLVAPQPGQVIAGQELSLELRDLLLREGRALLAVRRVRAAI